MKPSPSPRAIALTGGGTAGHVWPHFALFETPSDPLPQAVAKGEWRVVYFGSEDGMERTLVLNTPLAQSWTYIPLPSGKLRRYFSWKNFTDVFRILSAFWKAWRSLGSERVSCVFSKGGFVAAPVVWAAGLRGIPVVVHESDATPALTTKMSLPFARQILLSFEATQNSRFLQMFQDRVTVTGIPLRASLFSSNRETALKHFGFESGKPVLLIMGGSLGAEALNRAAREWLDTLLDTWQVLHLTGKGKGFPYERKGYVQKEFLSEEMAHAYRAASCALCRAGASSIFELAAARVPMILVPLTLAQSRGDQIVNAKLFARKGWALHIPEENLNWDTLKKGLEWAQSPDALQCLQSAPAPSAASRVGLVLLNLAERHKAAQEGAEPPAP